jgi:hypothetical protein
LVVFLLEVVQDVFTSFRVSTPRLDNSARALNNVDNMTFWGNLAQTNPFTERLGVFDLDERDVVFSAQSRHQVDVRVFGATFRQYAQVCFSTVQSLYAFTETTS